mmetsp:Transcript_8743/g.25689  ORF Transcript_8743/g.25689 Transcript_8743/m.25689 type:complete len:327 (-) Transcript_8743:20-1000(-)
MAQTLPSFIAVHEAVPGGPPTCRPPPRRGRRRPPLERPARATAAARVSACPVELAQGGPREPRPRDSGARLRLRPAKSRRDAPPEGRHRAARLEDVSSRRAARRRRRQRRRVVAEQHAHHRRRGGGDGAQVVPPLEGDHQPAGGEGAQLRRHVRVAGGGDLHAAERVARRRVEAGGDEDEIRRELARHRHQQPLEGGGVLRVAVPGRAPRNVEAEAPAGALADGVRAAGAWVKAVSVPVQRGVQHRAVLFKDVLDAVAVVDVPVNDQHALHAEPRARDRRRHGDVVEEAEAHRLPCLAVVARRPHHRQRVGQLSRHHASRELDDRA